MEVAGFELKFSKQKQGISRRQGVEGRHCQAAAAVEQSRGNRDTRGGGQQRAAHVAAVRPPGRELSRVFASGAVPFRKERSFFLLLPFSNALDCELPVGRDPVSLLPHCSSSVHPHTWTMHSRHWANTCWMN